MPVYVYVIINAALALLVVGVIVGLLSWSIATQHRQPGCEAVRLRLRRLRITISLAPLGSPEPTSSAQKPAFN
jgi:hypothetical protein